MKIFIGTGEREKRLLKKVEAAAVALLHVKDMTRCYRQNCMKFTFVCLITHLLIMQQATRSSRNFVAYRIWIGDNYIHF